MRNSEANSSIKFKQKQSKRRFKPQLYFVGQLASQVIVNAFIMWHNMFCLNKMRRWPQCLIMADHFYKKLTVNCLCFRFGIAKVCKGAAGTCEGFAKIAVHSGILHYAWYSWSSAMIRDQRWADLFNHFMKISFVFKRKTHHMWVEHLRVVFTRVGCHINSTPVWSYFQAEFAAASRRKLKEVAFSQLFNLNTWRREATLWKTVTFATFGGERLFWSRLILMQMLSIQYFAFQVVCSTDIEIHYLEYLESLNKNFACQALISPSQKIELQWLQRYEKGHKILNSALQIRWDQVKFWIEKSGEIPWRALNGYSPGWPSPTDSEVKRNWKGKFKKNKSERKCFGAKYLF